MKKNQFNLRNIVFLIMILAFFKAQAQSYLYQFPTSGAAHGVAIDGAGNAFVGSATTNQIQKYTNTGSLITTWGTPGTGLGQFQGIGAIAVDATGNVYVPDYGNNRVQKFDNNGQNPVALGVGYLNHPRGVAIDASGMIYVADELNARITILNPAGGFSRSISGSGLLNPMCVTLNPSNGDIYVTDYNRGVIMQFNNGGSYIRTFGSGQLANPWSIVFDAASNVLYVTDSGHNRVVKYNTTGSMLSSFGATGSGNAQFSWPSSIAIDKATGNIFVTDYGNNRVEVFGNCAGANYAFTATYSEPLVDGITVDINGNFYLKCGSQTGTNESHITALNPSMGFGKVIIYPSISREGAVAIDNNLNLYITELNRLIKINQTGTILASYYASDVLLGVAVDKSGYVYVSDEHNNQVIKLNQNLVPVSYIGVGVVDGGVSFTAPYGLALDGANNLFVASGYYIWKFNSNGSFIKKFGAGGTPSYFSDPRGVAVDKGGNVFVADHYNNRIQKFSNDGVYITQMAATGTPLYNYLVVDQNCNVYCSIYGSATSPFTGAVHKFGFTAPPQRLGEVEEEMETSTLQPAIHVVPNPTAGTFKVYFEKSGTFDVVLYTAQGKQIKQERVEGNVYEVSDENLAPGLYILQATGNGVATQTKVVIQK